MQNTSKKPNKTKSQSEILTTNRSNMVRVFCQSLLFFKGLRKIKIRKGSLK